MNAVTLTKHTQMKTFDFASTLQSIHVEGTVNGLLMNMSIRQHYKNTGSENLEAVYTFPLPWGATLLGLNVDIDGHRLKGCVLERKQATERYEEAIDKGDTPVMVERSAFGLYTANLGNLQPGEDAIVEIEYAQLLRFEQDQIRITLPTTVAPRYGDAHKKGGLARHESIDSNVVVQYPLTIQLTFHGEIAKANVQCPSHKITQSAQDNAKVVKLLENAYLDRDFVLHLQGMSGQSFVTVAPDGDEFAVLASFCPPAPQKSPEPMLLKILVDCSGSMGGDSIKAAKQALHEVMKEMSDQDWVSFSRFGSIVNHDHAGLIPCTSANVKKVAKLIANTKADLGGTEMNAALLSTFELGFAANWKTTLQASEIESRAKDVLLITDGNIWDIESVIASAKLSGHRIFAIGVGHSPSECLLRELADKTGGACELVTPIQNPAEVIVRMFLRMRSTRCTDIQLDWNQKTRWQCMLPLTIFGGDTVHLSARLKKAPDSPPVLLWRMNDFQMQNSASQVQTLSGDLLSRIVASHQLTQMTGKNAQNKASEIALRYQLVTDHTNLILVHVRDDGKKAIDLPKLEHITHMMSAAWGATASVGVCAGAVPYGAALTLIAPSRHLQLGVGNAGPFELPAFLRKQSTGTDSTGRAKRLLNIVDSVIGKVMGKASCVNPMDVLETFDREAQAGLESNQMLRVLDALTIPKELQSVFKDFLADPSSRVQAWAFVLQWLADRFASDFQFSRQATRLLRLWLKDKSPASQQKASQRLSSQLGVISATSWNAVSA
ncbi:MAG: VWA domain-containing protein [Comamonadaceae bacterium]|nr:VWA domain-containing protein [Comamonadaceae bacterium]